MKLIKFIIIIITTLCFSCLPSDGPYENCDEYYFSDEFKSYIFFKEGSYWIYEDTTYNLTDSIVLLKQDVWLNDYCDYVNLYQEKICQYYFSSLLSKFFDTIRVWGEASNGQFIDGSPVTGSFSLYLDSGSWHGTNYEYLDSLMLNQKWFFKVRVISYDEFKFYWAKDIGLIRKEYSYWKLGDTLYNFDLIRYNLNN
jgi:hypothetical protein